MADTASSVLRHWEAANVTSTTGSGVIVRNSEPGTVRLVRTACKALSKHGSELKVFQWCAAGPKSTIRSSSS